MPPTALRKMLASGLVLLVGALALALPGRAGAQLSDQQIGLQYGALTGLGGADVRVTAARIIRAALGLLGMVAVVIILIGGFTWMMAGGNEEKIGEAKKWILAGAIGLAIILSAYAIASFVVGSLIEATGYRTI